MLWRSQKRSDAFVKDNVAGLGLVIKGKDLGLGDRNADRFSRRNPLPLYHICILKAFLKFGKIKTPVGIE